MNTSKKAGGGLCLYTNNRWCFPGHITVKWTVSDPDIELLAVSCRPYYLPRETSHAIVIVVYIPPSANTKTAMNTICTITHELQSRSPDAMVIVNRDFNHCSLSSALPSFKQLVTCPTRNDRTIDLFYCNFKDSCVSHSSPPLGQSDHNLVYLSTKYTPIVRRQRATTKTVREWSEEASNKLQWELECTDWSIFFEDSDEFCSMFDYINFCYEKDIPC